MTAARDAAFAGHVAASTLVTVPALVRPEWKVEVAVVAATSSGLAGQRALTNPGSPRCGG